MKIKPIHLILIILAIGIIIFSLFQRPKNSPEIMEKTKIEETLNKEITSSEIKEETPLPKEDTYEERVKKMYELLPPGEVIIE